MNQLPLSTNLTAAKLAEKIKINEDYSKAKGGINLSPKELSRIEAMAKRNIEVRKSIKDSI